MSKKIKTIKWNELSEHAQLLAAQAMDGVENHRRLVAKPYGNGHSITTVDKNLPQQDISLAGWSLVIYE